MLSVSPHWVIVIHEGHICIDVDATARRYLRLGRAYVPGEVPGRRPETPNNNGLGRCFGNAMRCVREHPGLIYVEGIADGYFHAWAAEGDRAIEVTSSQSETLTYNTGGRSPPGLSMPDV